MVGSGISVLAAAPLAGAALGAEPAGTGADDFTGAAVEARGVHIHIAKSFFKPVG